MERCRIDHSRPNNMPYVTGDQSNPTPRTSGFHVDSIGNVSKGVTANNHREGLLTKIDNCRRSAGGNRGGRKPQGQSRRLSMDRAVHRIVETNLFSEPDEEIEAEAQIEATLQVAQICRPGSPRRGVRARCRFRPSRWGPAQWAA